MTEIASDHEKAARANILLNDPLLREALRSMFENAVESIRNSAPGDQQARESAYYMMQAIEDLREELKAHITQHVLNTTNKRG